jgi:hypothetical protein
MLLPYLHDIRNRMRGCSHNAWLQPQCVVAATRVARMQPSAQCLVLHGPSTVTRATAALFMVVLCMLMLIRVYVRVVLSCV